MYIAIIMLTINFNCGEETPLTKSVKLRKAYIKREQVDQNRSITWRLSDMMCGSRVLKKEPPVINTDGSRREEESYQNGSIDLNAHAS